MRSTFQTNPARPAFGVLNESNNASDYIANKRAKTIFCVANRCAPRKSINTSSNLLHINKANYLKYYKCLNALNTSNLNSNLFTKLNLMDVAVIQKNIVGPPIVYETPTSIDSSLIETPYNTYTIDPSGQLFGNTTCGIKNYLNYIEYNADSTN